MTTGPTTEGSRPARRVRMPSRPEDIVIVSAVRTPITKAKRGGLKDATPDQLLVTVLTEVLKQTRVGGDELGEICVGNVLQAGSGHVSSRMAQLVTGIPHSVPLSTVNRQCSSGLQAIANVAAGIKNGYYDMGIAAGVECMSLANMKDTVPQVQWAAVKANKDANDCTIPMGITSENVAAKHGIPRDVQDAFSADSHRKAASAQSTGKFREEIVPVQYVVKDKEGNMRQVTVSQDDGVRGDTTAEKLSKLKPAFKEGGTTTAGNSSQVSDGAAACLLTTRARAQQLGLPVLGTLRSFAVAGVPPAIMGVGPAFAIPNALQKAGLQVDDVDVFEINEAFASQAVFCVQELGIPPEKVNPNGGAIALGHPLGATGCRQVATLLHELKRTGGTFGVVSMCIGTGMGAAAVFEAGEGSAASRL